MNPITRAQSSSVFPAFDDSIPREDLLAQIAIVQGDPATSAQDGGLQSLSRRQIQHLSANGVPQDLYETKHHSVAIKNFHVSQRPINDPNQYDVTSCCQQIKRCVENTDDGGILEAIQKLAKLPVVSIDNPLIP